MLLNHLYNLSIIHAFVQPLCVCSSTDLTRCEPILEKHQHNVVCYTEAYTATQNSSPLIAASYSGSSCDPTKSAILGFYSCQKKLI